MLKYEFKRLSNAPLALLKASEQFSEFFGTSLLFSNDTSLSSLLFLFPFETVLIENGHPNPWDILKEKIGSFESDSPLPTWSGYLGYEMGAFSDNLIELPHSFSPYPLAYFQKSAIRLNQKDNQVTLWIDSEAKEQALRFNPNCASYFELSFWTTFFSQDPSLCSIPGDVPGYKEQDTLSSYVDKIERAKEFICAGDVYQVNLSRSVSFNTHLPSFEIYKRLIQVNPTPYSAFLNYGSFEIISISPEKFLSHRSGYLETRPIKGTIARGGDAHSDKLQRQKLYADPKEDAELMMICDLMRNDLGQICKIGSVHCPKLKQLLTLSNLYHMESVICGEGLEMHPVDYLRHCFPAGSITGCPKLRSMQIIHLLEKRPRHIYCGAIGYIAENGDFDFNVAIRTAVKKGDSLELQIGGAITYDSDPIKEYEETQTKAASFNQVLLESSAIL